MAARNRRRARDRGARPTKDQPSPIADGEHTGAPAEPAPGAEAESDNGPESPPESLEHVESPPESPERIESPPAPLEHAAAYADLDNPQVLLGSAGFVRQTDDASEEYDRIYADEIPEGAADENAPEPSAADGGGAGAGRGPGGPAAHPGGGGGGELALPTPAAPEHQGTFSRLTNFLRGSWRELHRVQWPDRRQVMQATGVVLGFVIVAGVYLGVADYVSQKVVHFILTK